jgi:two-component system, sensor histidine kinase YesM
MEYKAMKFTYSLRFRLTILFILTTVIPVLILGFAMPFYYHSLLSKETQKLTENTLSSLTQNIETYLDDLERLTITPYLNEDVMFSLKLKASGQYEKANPYTKLVADRALYNTLPDYLKNTRHDILGTILLPFDGSVFVTSNNYSTGAKPNYPYKSQNWYKKAVNADGRVAFISAHFQDYLKKDQASQVFSVARLIKDPDSSKPLAVMMANADTVILKKILKDIKFNVSSTTAIFDDKGQLIYSNHPIPNQVLQQHDENKSIIKGEKDTYVTVEKDIEKTKWKVMVLLSNSELKAKVRWMYLAGLCISIGGVIVIFIIFFVTSRWLIKPFKEMTKVMKEVQEGDLKVRFNTHGKDEVAQLGNALNTMISQLNKMIDREFRAALNQKNAEFRALQSQIQPHFLYNTLNGFIGLNRLGDTKGLEKAILGLSGMLRYILDQGDWTTVKEELQFLQKYCNLQKLRFTERLDVQIHCEPEVEHWKVPKLLLQPLTENAIIHGVEPVGRPCVVTIEAKRDKLDDNSFLLMSIRDNGLGFDLTSDFYENNRIGINNIKERLNISYPHAQFEIKSQLGAGTEIEIRIPEEDLKK